MNPALKVFLGVVIGGTLGGFLGYYGKCTSGTCPLTSNPYMGTIFGAIIGLMFTLPR